MRFQLHTLSCQYRASLRASETAEIFTASHAHIKNMKSIKSVLLLGSGALKIGEAGEFDYSGTQAIKALKEEGVKVILVNPNVATVQTSEGLADRIYYLPVTSDFVERVIEKEKPDGIMLSFGGQTALNCGLSLAKNGILSKYNVEVLGTPITAIDDTEDRQKFSQKINQIGLATARGSIVESVASGINYAEKLGYPVMVRAGFALGGTGSGVAVNEKMLGEILNRAFATTTQVIIEECLSGWKELEYEVVRDNQDNCIVVCNMENFDPVGIHTGESIVVAPSQTLNNAEYFKLRECAIRAIREFKIIGECNIQFALHPTNGELRVIEVNARLSRSSALASKATGYPLAYIAAKLALGKMLPELTNEVTGKTSACFEPALDYIVVKIPRWDLDKFTHVTPVIGSEMKSVGEVMAIGRTFAEAIQKATRMLNDGYDGIVGGRYNNLSKKDLIEKLKNPDSMRLFTIVSALAQGVSQTEIHDLTQIDLWFIGKLSEIILIYQNLLQTKELNLEMLKTAKQFGFSDRQIADIFNTDELSIRKKRIDWRIIPFIKNIDTMAGEFPAVTNYLYLTYNAEKSDYLPQKSSDKVIVLGSGPYSIGTSVEFDYCAVHTVKSLQELGKKAVVINCNPETVSTDYDISDFLYFEELTFERVMDICDMEKSPVIVAVGGQISNNLAPKLDAQKVQILGTKTNKILDAENRNLFSQMLDNLSIKQPKWTSVNTNQDTIEFAGKIGYPILARPSFVLSGKAMCVIESDDILRDYLKNLDVEVKKHPIVISQFLTRAIECDLDAVAQKGKIIIYTIAEHIEYGGVHSGDATMMLPPQTINPEILVKIKVCADKIVASLEANGPLNIQFLVHEGEIYVIECNLRASRSIAYAGKVYHQNFISLATKIMLGQQNINVKLNSINYVAVKAPQFSFHKLRGSDPVTTVEMNSTGEVVGFGRDKYEAYLKAILGTQIKYPVQKTAFISLGGSAGKLEFLESVKKLADNGFKLFATSGTSLFLRENGIEVNRVGKIYEGIGLNAIDLLKAGKIDFAVVIPEKASETKRGRLVSGITDGYLMRRMAIDMGIPIFTNAQNAGIFVDAILRYSPDTLKIEEYSEYTN
jgi:carbamoyl-phosphate synthase large subunit